MTHPNALGSICHWSKAHSSLWLHVDLLKVTIQKSGGNVDGVTFKVTCSHKCKLSMHNREVEVGAKDLT